MDAKGTKMTLPTGNRRNDNAFTLIELILVMAMLAIVISVALPSLKGFFRGRNLDSEARRFLSLTRYGQSRAVSEGVPMELWIDARQKAYGLQAQAGYADVDTNTVQFTLDKELQVEAVTPSDFFSAVVLGAWQTRDELSMLLVPKKRATFCAT